MVFERNTIMGQVLTEVNNAKENNIILDDIKDLIEYLDVIDYNDYTINLWNQDGLCITTNIFDDHEKKDIFVIETDYAYELSWLVDELVSIYKPSEKDKKRFFETISYLISIYIDKYDDIILISRMVTLVSTVFLHPDHIGQDKFIVHPIKLPDFGKEF